MLYDGDLHYLQVEPSDGTSFQKIILTVILYCMNGLSSTLVFDTSYRPSALKKFSKAGFLAKIVSTIESFMICFRCQNYKLSFSLNNSP